MITLASEDQLINKTTSLCKVCKNGIDASIVSTLNNEVWMKKTCLEHGQQNVMLSNNAQWYKKNRTLELRNSLSHSQTSSPSQIHKEKRYGCPFDCGLCESHQQKIRLPIVTITSSCNLSCPVCFVYNKNIEPYNMSFDEFKTLLNNLISVQNNELDVINFTGGDPTLHPHFMDFVELSLKAGFQRVSICSNGIRFAEDELLTKRFAELNGRIALSFDSFNNEAYYEFQGVRILDVKIKCLELFEKYKISTTLITVINKGVNDKEIGKIIEITLSKPNIRHLEIHTITYTGQGGISYDRSRRTSTFEVLEMIELTTKGFLKIDDFIPSPCAHSLCYQITYLLLDPEGGKAIPFTRFMDQKTLYECLGDRLYLEPSLNLEAAMRNSIDDLWTQDDEESERILKILKRLLEKLYPVEKTISEEEQLKISEESVKAIYVYSHMDEEIFDVERIVKCCDGNSYADGSSVPVCAYNVLYREKEANFNINPRTWDKPSGGRF